MSSSQSNPTDCLNLVPAHHSVLPSTISAPRECGTCVPHTLSFFCKRVCGGLSGAKIPGRRAALAADVWNFEQPRPRWVAEHMRRPTGRMYFTVLKDICSLGQSYLCVSAVSPSGTHRVGGACAPQTTPATRCRARFSAHPLPLPYVGREQGSPNKTCVR
jgi:hypothetical protein